MFGALLLVHVAAPFLRLDRVPPLAALASVLEPLGLYRLLVADDAALQRFRLYASGVGALAAVGLSMAVGVGADRPEPPPLLPWALVGTVLRRPALRVRQPRLDDRRRADLGLPGRLVAPAPAPVAALVVFGTLDLIALGLAQRGLNLRTVVERLDFWRNGLLLAAETPFTGVGLGRRVGADRLPRRLPAVLPAVQPRTQHLRAGAAGAGVLGIASLILVSVALVRLGAVPPGCGDPRARAASLAALGGALALLTAGLTEIVALTTVGGALLFGLLGLLVASHDAARATAASPGRRCQLAQPRSRLFSLAACAFGPVLAVLRAQRRTSEESWPASSCSRSVASLLTGSARSLAALPFLNAGTVALYQGTLAEDPRPRRARTGARLGHTGPSVSP